MSHFFIAVLWTYHIIFTLLLVMETRSIIPTLGSYGYCYCKQLHKTFCVDVI